MHLIDEIGPSYIKKFENMTPFESFKWKNNIFLPKLVFNSSLKMSKIPENKRKEIIGNIEKISKYEKELNEIQKKKYTF